MIETMFRTEDLPSADRFDAWCERLALTHAPSDLTSAHQAGYRGTQHLLQFNELTVHTMQWQPAFARRNQALIHLSDPDRYHLSLIRRGTVVATIDDQEAVYGPCALRTNLTYRPIEVNLGADGTEVECVSMEISRAAFPLPPARMERVIGRPMTAMEGTGALLAAFLNTLTSQPGSYTPADAARLEPILLDLLASLFAHELDVVETLPPETHHRTLLLRVRAFIRQHLHDPGLTPTAIAAVHHISVSQLHRIFRERALAEGGPSTVMGYIRAQRLERARRDLADPALRTRPVGEIAHRWGFTHHVVFTRAFRAAYGIPPRDYRHLELAQLARNASPAPLATDRQETGHSKSTTQQTRT
ncbi:AraC family transcriptional regulator [Streptomyces spinoverrucosus]|uniref:AraC family transcriptional regulator n=1 Tax=Streptomyces spinoverrucosus TaxID=284043 RepID=UPI0018C3D17F|nr:AraC family transcriptional regulator [Streptomyces spinoverrucosus]MBG0850427.1 AraC family transcriptional regulator [Streptomyces spinoverrucosus]